MKELSANELYEIHGGGFFINPICRISWNVIYQVFKLYPSVLRKYR